MSWLGSGNKLCLLKDDRQYNEVYLINSVWLGTEGRYSKTDVNENAAIFHFRVWEDDKSILFLTNDDFKFETRCFVFYLDNEDDTMRAYNCEGFRESSAVTLSPYVSSELQSEKLTKQLLDIARFKLRNASLKKYFITHPPTQLQNNSFVVNTRGSKNINVTLGKR